jgi:hypothetical protein
MISVSFPSFMYDVFKDFKSTSNPDAKGTLYKESSVSNQFVKSFSFNFHSFSEVLIP